MVEKYNNCEDEKWCTFCHYVLDWCRCKWTWKDGKPTANPEYGSTINDRKANNS